MDTWTDGDLVRSSRDGNKAAFGLLVDRYRALVTRLASRTIGDTDLAHDLAQEVFLQAFLSLDDLRNAARFKSWLYGITLNVCRTYLRSQRYTVYSLEAALGGTSHDEGPTVEEILERLDLYQSLASALNELSSANRAAVVLVYYYEFSLREAADMLGISVTALKGRLHKARLKLETKLRSESESPGVRKGVTRMIPVKIVDVRRTEILADSGISAISTQVILYDAVGRRAIVIWVGEPEGLSIVSGLLKRDTPRPMTQVFIARLLQVAKATVESVEVNAIKDSVYYATLRLRTGTEVTEVDARPSDALALALQLDVPIYVSEEVLKAVGTVVPEGKSPTGKLATDFIAQLDARDQLWAEYRAKQQAQESEEEHTANLEREQMAIISETFDGA